MFPEAKATEIEASYSGKGRLPVKMFGRRKKVFDLYTVEGGSNVERFNPDLSPKQIKKALSLEESEDLIAEKEKEIEELLKDQIITDAENKTREVRERAKERIAEKHE